jgi:hypothetical protein
VATIKPFVQTADDNINDTQLVSELCHKKQSTSSWPDYSVWWRQYQIDAFLQSNAPSSSYL